MHLPGLNLGLLASYQVFNTLAEMVRSGGLSYPLWLWRLPLPLIGLRRVRGGKVAHFHFLHSHKSVLLAQRPTHLELKDSFLVLTLQLK